MWLPTRELQIGAVAEAITQQRDIGLLKVLRELFPPGDNATDILYGTPAFRKCLAKEVYPGIQTFQAAGTLGCRYPIVGYADLRIAILELIIAGWRTWKNEKIGKPILLLLPDAHFCLQFLVAAHMQFDPKVVSFPRAFAGLEPLLRPEKEKLTSHADATGLQGRIADLVRRHLQGEVPQNGNTPFCSAGELEPWLNEPWLPEDILAKILSRYVSLIGVRNAYTFMQVGKAAQALPMA